MRIQIVECYYLSTFTRVSPPEVLWQKNIESSIKDFLSQVITTIDGQ